MKGKRKFTLIVFALFMITQFTFLGLIVELGMGLEWGFLSVVFVGILLLIVDFVSLYYLIFRNGDGK